MKCVILCAGKGSRMGGGLPKILSPIDGKPLLEYVIDTWKDVVDGFIFVVGYRWRDVAGAIPNGGGFVIQKRQKGIADAILKAEELTCGDKFVVALGDCIQIGNWELPIEDWDLGIGVWKTNNYKKISDNYSVEVKDGYVSKVVEKPKVMPNNYCGMGTYFFDKRIFKYIKNTPPSQLRGEVEITDSIQLMIDSGEKITPIFFNGEYLNVTYSKDLKTAEEMLSAK